MPCSSIKFTTQRDDSCPWPAKAWSFVENFHAVFSAIPPLHSQMRTHPQGGRLCTCCWRREVGATLPPSQALLRLQALAERVSSEVILPLVHARDRAAMHQTQEPGATAALQRRDSADAREGGLEAALLATVRFLAGPAQALPHSSRTVPARHRAFPASGW